jgi:ATP-binding cassette subfamily C (CFTR/MRP) protein 10
VYLIDDIFSAVDPGVADHIYRACLSGLLAERTRVLCTHHTRFLAQADLVLCLQEGRITEAGPPQGAEPAQSGIFLTACLKGVKNAIQV